MAFPRSCAAACCLLALFVFKCAVVSATQGTGANVQQAYADRHDGYRYEHEDRHSGPHGGYDRHEEDSYYKQEPYYGGEHAEGPYDAHKGHEGYHGKHIVPICLQRTSNYTGPDGVMEDKFRCCTPRDEPDTCTHNSTYGGYDYEQRRKDQDSFMGVLTDDHAAVCKYAVLVDESCPSFLSTGTTCEVLQMNCTLTREAAKCGCFTEKGLFFSTTVYSRTVDSLMCIKPDSATAVTPVSTRVSYLQGAIDAYVTREGYMECEGSVEYMGLADTAGTTPVTKPYPEMRWSRENQLIVRLVLDK